MGCDREAQAWLAQDMLPTASRILGHLLSKTLPGSTAQAGLEHEGLMQRSRARPRASPALLPGPEGRTGPAGATWPHAQTMATQLARPSLGSQPATSRALTRVTEAAFEVRMVPADPGPVLVASPKG